MKVNNTVLKSEQFAQASNDSNSGKHAAIAVAALITMASALPTWAVYDTTAITTGVADAATAVGVIGAAVVLVILSVKVFKWIGRAL